MRPVFLAALLAMSGCATQPPQPAVAVEDPSRACLVGLGSDQRFAGIWTKTPARLDDASIQHLVSTERASEDDKRMLSVMAVARQTCLEMGRELRRAYAPPEWNAAFDRGQSRYLDLMADLYAGKITYGEFTRGRKDIQAVTERLFAEIKDRDQQRAAAQRQQAINNILLIQSMQPRQVNCSTRYIGSTAYTSCQ